MTTTTRYDSADFLDLVRPFVTVDDQMIVKALRNGSKRVLRTQGLMRVEFSRDAEDKRVFSATHEGFGFGKLVRFKDTDNPAVPIYINTGEPLIQPFAEPDRTVITSEYFGNNGAGLELNAVAIVALQPRNTTEALPTLIFDEYADLLRASAMLELVEFLNPDNTYNRDWRGEYVRESDGARERHAVLPTEGQRPHSFFRPAGGGYAEPGRFYGARIGRARFGPRR